MLRSKYITAIALCIFGLLQGAAVTEVASVREQTDKLQQLSACFIEKKTLVPGSKLYYAPVIVGRLLDIPDRSIGKRASVPSEKVMRVVCGLVQGKDATLTQEAADLITTFFATGKADDLLARCYASICIQSKEWTERIIGGDVLQLKKIMKTRCTLEVFQSKKDARDPLKIALGVWLESGPLSKSIFGEEVVAANVHEKLRKVASCYKEDASMKDKLAVLAQYAATLTSSHEATVLTFDYARYLPFLKQLFGD